MEFVLDYSKWRCGGGDGNSVNQLGKGETQMRNHKGYMCCLGQFSRQCGVSAKKLTNAGEPDEVLHSYSPRWVKANGDKLSPFVDFTVDDDDGLLDEYVDANNTELSTTAISINDNDSTTPDEKIVELKELFKQYGHTIKVVNHPNGIE